MLNLTVLILVTTCVTTALAQPRMDANSERAVEQMTQIISAHLTTLDQSVVTFHYEHDANFNPRSLADVQKRVVGWPETFFDPDKNPSVTAGPGTYVAIDPAGSRNFGADKPQLTVFTLKAGTRVFATGPEMTDAERTILDRIKSKFACRPETKADELIDIVSHFRYGEANCRQVIIEAMRRARVQAILYNYDASNALAGCRRRGEAFNIISSDAFDVNLISYYEPGRAFEGRKLGTYLARLYPEAMREFHATTFADPDQLGAPMPNLEPAAYPLYRGWKTHNLYKCGAVTAAERDDHRVLVRETLSAAMWDRRITELFRVARRAFNRRGTGDRVLLFELSMVREVERAEYLALGFPDDFSRFGDYLNAKNRMSASQPEEFAALEQLLGEAGRLIPSITEEAATRAWIASSPQGDLDDPNLLYKQFRALGKGPRLATLRADMMVKNYGGAPYIAEMPRESAGADSRRGYERSVRMTVDILARCIKIYEDPHLTVDQVQASSCGVRQYGDKY